MSRVHGKDVSTLTLNAQSLKTDTIHIDFSASAAVHDTSAIGTQWMTAVAGLKGGDSIQHQMFYDNTVTTGTWAFLTNLLGGAAVTLVIGDGVRTISVSVIVEKVSLPIPVNDLLKFTASYKLTGTVTFS